MVHYSLTYGEKAREKHVFPHKISTEHETYYFKQFNVISQENERV